MILLLKRIKQGASEASVPYVGADFYADFYGDLYSDLYGDFYGDFYGDTFVATNFLISLFLFFPLYDFYFILLASQRASQRASLAKRGSVAPTDPPGYAPVVIFLRLYTFTLYWMLRNSCMV